MGIEHDLPVHVLYHSIMAAPLDLHPKNVLLRLLMGLSFYPLHTQSILSLLRMYFVQRSHDLSPFAISELAKFSEVVAKGHTSLYSLQTQ